MCTSGFQVWVKDKKIEMYQEHWQQYINWSSNWNDHIGHSKSYKNASHKLLRLWDIPWCCKLKDDVDVIGFGSPFKDFNGHSAICCAQMLN